MSASSVVSELPGVHCCVVGDANGHVVEPSTTDAKAISIAANVTALAQEFEQIGDLLQLGATGLVTIKGAPSIWVVGYRSGSSLAVEVSPNHPIAAVENVLRATNWPSMVEHTISDAEIEYVDPVLPVTTKAQSQKTANIGPPVPEPEVRSGPAKSGARLPVAISHQEPEGATRTDLRRALVKGQLAQAETIAAKLRTIPSFAYECGSAESVRALHTLLDGIASMLAGDNQGAIESFRFVESSRHSGWSLQWVAKIWTARARLFAGADLRAAGDVAESALELANRLDAEARATNLLVLAEIAYRERNMDAAAQHARKARELFIVISDAQELASCWLLEARLLAELKCEKESIEAAERARRLRASWPPPATFIARQALQAGRLEDARSALVPLLKLQPTSTEILQTARLLDQVRAGVLPIRAACEFLRELDMPATRESTQKLEQLSRRYPNVEQFREAVGWRLVRAGDYAAATKIFEQLSNKSDLPDDIRSSVLLALGCLATIETRHAKTGVRLRAAVDAAPKHLQSSRPPAPSVGEISIARPVEFRLSEPRSLAPGGFAEVDGTSTSPRLARGGPVFSGSIQMFGLPDLLEFLRSGQRTGTLICSSVAGIGAIHLRYGRLTGAAAPNTPGLHDYLMAFGATTREQLDVLPGISADDWTRPQIGMLLLRAKVVTPDQVKLALHDQIRDAMREMLQWGEGQFAFDPEVVTESSTCDVDIELDSQAILLDIFREMDEKSRATS